jgi:hypothetical protein
VVPRYDFVDWDDPSDVRGNVVHIAAHGVTIEEWEEVLDGLEPEGESRSSGLPAKHGWTTSGKYLYIVFKVFERGGFRIARPVTGYEVNP